MPSRCEIEPVGELRSKWGEGPLWWEGALYYVDIEGRALRRLDPATGVERSWQSPFKPACLVPLKGGGLLVGGEGGLYRADLELERFEHLVDPQPHPVGHRLNDGKCAPDGRLWVGSISQDRTATAKLFCVEPDLRHRVGFEPVTNSNGLAWSVSGSHFFYIDTPRKQVLCFDYEHGYIRNPRVVLDTRALSGVPDGMTVDTKGRLWIAMVHGRSLLGCDPSTGAILHHLELPCLEPTSLCFGGPGRDELFVTTGMPPGGPGPLDGAILRVRGLNAQGLPPTPFSLNIR